MPAYFLVSVPLEQQYERKSKIGSIYLHPNFVYMTRGMQCGKIESIGSTAHGMLPEARIGDTLLFHHFVESSEKAQCVDMDRDFAYYVVTSMSHNGQNNQCYGVFDGQRIIPHPDYLFLESEPPPDKSLTLVEARDAQLVQKESGLFLFKSWKIDREGMVKEMDEIKAQIASLTKPGTRMNPEIAKVIQAKEAEMNRISKALHYKRFELYTLVAASSLFTDQVAEEMGCTIAAGDTVYMLGIACQTKMEFNGTEYIVAKSIHFGAPQAWVTEQFNRSLNKELAS